MATKTRMPGKVGRMGVIAQVRKSRDPQTPIEQIAIVRCASVNGVSVRNRINKRRELARKGYLGD